MKQKTLRKLLHVVDFFNCFTAACFYSSKPLTVVYGYEFPNMKEYMESRLPNVTHHLVKMKDPFGTHHS